MASTSSLICVISYTKKPSLALSNASPSMRILVERTTNNGYECGRLCRITLKSPTLTDPIEEKRRSLYLKLRGSNYTPLESDVKAADEAVGWWLTRTTTHLTLLLRGSSYDCDERVKDLNESPVDPPVHMLPLLRKVYLFRYNVAFAAWICMCPALEILKLSNCVENASNPENKTAAMVLTQQARASSSLSSMDSLISRHEEDHKQLLPFNARGSLASLKEIAIDNTTVTSLEWVLACTNLETLVARVTVGCAELRFLDSYLPLKKLDLSSSHIHFIEWLEQCTSLEDVNIGACGHIIDLTPLGHLGLLCNLDINRTHVNEDMEWIRGCPLLEQLNMERCQISDGVSLGAIGSLSNLLYLNVCYTSISDMGWIRGCVSLETLLAIYCTSISDFGPIGSLSGLRHLDVSLTHLATMEWIRGNCGLLTKLCVDECTHCIDFSAIGTLTRLKDLSISSNTTLQYIDWITECRAMRVLYIQNNPNINDLRCIQQLDNLQKLYQ